MKTNSIKNVILFYIYNIKMLCAKLVTLSATLLNGKLQVKTVIRSYSLKLFIVLKNEKNRTAIRL